MKNSSPGTLPARKLSRLRTVARRSFSNTEARGLFSEKSVIVSLRSMRNGAQCEPSTSAREESCAQRIPRWGSRRRSAQKRRRSRAVSRSPLAVGHGRVLPAHPVVDLGQLELPEAADLVRGKAAALDPAVD